MPDLLEQFAQETIDELLKRPETVDAILKNATPEERVKDLSPEERVKDLSVDELLAALPAEKRAEFAKRLKGEDGSSK